MKLKISYRLYSKIFYDRISIEMSDECKDVSFIKQHCKFQIQTQLKETVAALYIESGDIKKFKLIE